MTCCQATKASEQFQGFLALVQKPAVSSCFCCGECSEAKDQVEQLSMIKKVYFFFSCLLGCVAITLVATALVCLHDVSLMYACCGKCLWSGGRSARTTHVAHVVSSPHKPLQLPMSSLPLPSSITPTPNLCDDVQLISVQHVLMQVLETGKFKV
jgi:hypothetical protein